ncbi:MAG TPA: ABC transporter permease, partial [Puia sp.]|nr:ABC transporter permease [Puia sp.]
FKTAWRNLIRNKTFSFINILGLALGMACSLLILLWINDEKSVDTFHVNASDLYDVYYRQFFNKDVEAVRYTSGSLPDELKKSIPEIQYASGFREKRIYTFEAGKKIIKENAAFAGADFFKMFSYPLVQGSTETALRSPESIAISQKMANDLFGDAKNAIGRAIRYENKMNFTVTAIFKDLPENTSDGFDCLINWTAYLEENPWAKEWGNYGPSTYIMLNASANAAHVQQKLTHFMDKYIGSSDSYKIELGMQHFGDMYLYNKFKNGKIDGGRIEYLKLFSIIAIFVLLIACINFMNLTTAHSVKRAKEIGIRKVAGAVRSALIRQFIGESIWLTFIAVVLAILFSVLVMPLFNQLTSKQIVFPYSDFSFWLILVALTLATGFIAGSYPALFLSSFNVTRVLKGAPRFSSSAIFLRKGLVIFQFVLSVTLIIATMIVSRQIHFIQARNLGYDRDNLMYVSLDGDLIKKYETLKDEVSKTEGVENVTRISDAPTDLNSETFGVDWIGKDPNTSLKFEVASVGYGFTKTMKLQFVEGRDFSKNFATDSAGYILNEAAVRQIGYKDPVGKPITFWQKKGTIIGVLKDFHFNSLHESIKPLILRLGENESYGQMLVRSRAGETKKVIKQLEFISKQLNPDFPLSYTFADEEFQKLYTSENIIEKLSVYFASLAIFICSIGLLGLSMFTTEQRMREIGIRKVLGAGTASLFRLLSRQFLLLVIIALFLASPIAWYGMNRWLQDFAYRTTISWWTFISAGMIAIVIALITVSFHAIKAAFANPVRSLKTE